jgi:CheY-like chemotaxis protein
MAKETVMRRIPVVDDDLHIRLAIRAWLKQYGFRPGALVRHGACTSRFDRRRCFA